MTDREQRAQLDLLARLNRRHLAQTPGEAELAARIESFELAYRMQMAAPEALDLERENAGDAAAVRPRQSEVRPFRQAMPDRPADGRARRAVRADLQRRHGKRTELGRPHRHRRATIAGFAGETDKPIAGAADRPASSAACSTRRWCIWCGEFGRLPIAQKGEHRAAITIRTPSPPGWPAAA